ncbi:MAG: Uncharacterized protein G01um10147_785 [Microgenomates group bacterium Gr01-1014_7]|nr:MAG: Uncharacterized protein G01um10147_785 [Microgenomates group bacterium Gr01-1014_7]
MDNFIQQINSLKETGTGIIKRAMGIVPEVQKQFQPVKQIQQDISNRFQSWQKTVQPISQQIKETAYREYLKPRPFQTPQLHLENLQKGFQAVQQRFEKDTTNRLDELKPRFQDFYQDLQNRGQRINQQYIHSVQQEVGNFINFVQGNDQARNQRLAELYPQPKSEEERNRQMADMAINFSPMGVQKVGVRAGELLIPKLVEEGKQILSKLDKSDRLAHLLNYSNELLKAGYSKPQIEKISGAEAASLLKNNIKASERFGAELPGSGNESMRFLKDMQEEVQRIGKPTYQAKELDSVMQNVSVKQKVNLLDYLRTPNRVFEKIGLKNESDLLRQKYDDYLKALPHEISNITNWAKRASQPGANERIFNYLDGKKIPLDPNELQVATEIKSYLKGWATKLKLPEDKQISDYITHLFPQGVVEKEFDPEIAKLIRSKVVSSVWDPFLQKRTGKPEYNTDTWAALSAYVKRATRKFQMDPALEVIAAKADSLPEESYNYVKNQIAKINMQPTDLDNLLDNLVKSTPISYKLGQRPTNVVTQSARQAVFRSLLGLNPLSALRNLQQTTNTYAIVGEKNLIVGAIKTLQNLPRYLLGKDTELEAAGVIGKDIVQDRTISAVHKFWERADKTLFYMFNTAEKINRSFAYFGAKAQGISKGMTEEAAIKYAKEIVGRTQFMYDVIDTPAILQSDIAKTLLQFGTYPLKQSEFLIEMVKRKDVIGSIRWLASNVLFIATIGKILGLDYKDTFPAFRFGAPALQLPVGAVQSLTQDTDKYGNKLTPQDRILNPNVTRGALHYVPAGSQIKKTYEGLKAVQEGGSYSKSGQLQYPVKKELQPIILGKNQTEAAQQHYDEDIPNLGSKQTQQYIQMINSGISPTKAYTIFEKKREIQKLLDEKKAELLKKKPTLKPSVDFNLLDLLPKLIKEVGAADKEEENLIMSLFTQEQKSAEQVANVKDIYSLGLSKAETDKMLQDFGVKPGDAEGIILKSLEVENGNRGKALASMLKGLDSEAYKAKLEELAGQKLLTYGVTSEWSESGRITLDQKKGIDRLIRSVINPSSSTTASKPKIKRMPIKSPSLKVSKTKKIKAIKVPTLKPVILKPLKVSALKIKPQLKARTKKLNFQKLNRGQF